MASAAIDPAIKKQFDDIRKKKVPEFEQSFIKAMREHRFDDALEIARTVLALEPGNVRMQQFLPLLEEKAELDETSSSGVEDDEEGGEEAGGEGEASGSGEESDDEEDEEDDEDDDEDEDEDEDEAGTSGTGAVDELAEGVSAIALSKDNLKLSAAQRKAMRSGLVRSIKDLKLKEHAAKLAGADPLLGA